VFPAQRIKFRYFLVENTRKLFYNFNINMKGRMHFMKIGLVVHSKTGNTLSVAERLKNALAARGNGAEIIRVSAQNEEDATKGKVSLNPVPDISGFDAYVFAAPVWGFTLSAVMRLYLDGIADLGGKKAALFVTHQFPRPWMGGNRAARQLESALTKKGSKVTDKGVVDWSSKTREEQIAALVERIAAEF